MSYEQFLKQLSRIGLQMIVFGTCGLIVSAVIYLGTGINIGIATWVALACAGFAIYPTTSEE